MMKIQLVVSIVFIITSISFGLENKIISGIIYNSSTNEVIPDVNIFIPIQITGTSTKEDGTFSLSYLPINDPILIISHIGYASKRILLNNNTENLIITLDEIFFQADDVVVTGTGTEKIYKDVPIATEVITKKDILDSGANDVKELLLARSGININPSVYGAYDVNIRGMDSRNIIIMIDGQPIKGKFYDRVSLDHIPIGKIEKIEITKGPSSSLYGSEAMAGAINIISNSSIENNYFNIGIKYSSIDNKKYLDPNDGYNRFKIEGLKNFNKFVLSYNTAIEQISANKLIKESDIDKITKYSLNTLLEWKLNQNHNIKFRDILYQHYEDGLTQLINTETTIKRNNFSINHNYNIGNNWTLNQILQKQKYSRNYVEKWNSGYNNGEIQTDDLANENYYEYEIILNKKYNNKSINIGVETSSESYKSNRIGISEQFINSYSVFSQYDLHFFDNYNLITGIRIDKYSNYDLVYSPRVGVMYSYGRHWKLRTSWGKGFRTPSFMERFIDYDHLETFGYKVKGNNLLMPEESNGITAGVEYFHPNVYQVSLTIYYNEFINHITEYYKGNQEYSYYNIDNTYKGLEIRGKWTISSRLSASWEINLVDNRFSDGGKIPNTQPVSASNRFSYQSPNKPYGISINTKWTGSYIPSYHDVNSKSWLSEESRDSYFVSDLSGNYNYNSIKINVGIKNVSDYVNLQYGPFIRRSYYFEISSQLFKKDM